MKPKNTKRKICIGDIYLMNFSGKGNEQCGWRPGVVFQNNVGNEYSPNVIALPLTSSIKKLDLPTHVVVLAKDTGLIKDSVVLCENPERMSKERLGAYITTLSKNYMSKIAAANLLATSAISFIEPDLLLVIWQRSLLYNDTV